MVEAFNRGLEGPSASEGTNVELVDDCTMEGRRREMTVRPSEGIMVNQP
jgi:hypothetical protein